MGSLRLPLSLRVTLAHAAVDFYAKQEGIRILHFKGPLAVEDFPQRPAGMGDVDVLVDPTRVLDLVSALRREGWLLDGEMAYPSTNHAIVLTEDSAFHCTFDLHIRYPGIALPDEEAFELFWTQRETRFLAQRKLDSLNLPAHAQLLLLEAARNYSDDPQHNSRKIAGVARELSKEQWHHFWDFAASTGAQGILSAILPDVPGSPSHASIPPAWRLRISEGGGLAVWWARFSEAQSLSQRVQILRQAIFLRQADESERTKIRMSAIAKRWRRGIAQLKNLSSLYDHALQQSPPRAQSQSILNSDETPLIAIQARQKPGRPKRIDQDTTPPTPEISEPLDTSLRLPDLTTTPMACVELITGVIEHRHLAIAQLTVPKILIVNGPGILLWLAHMDPTITRPIETVQACYEDLPANSSRILEKIEERLKEAGLIL